MKNSKYQGENERNKKKKRLNYVAGTRKQRRRTANKERLKNKKITIKLNYAMLPIRETNKTRKRQKKKGEWKTRKSKQN